MTAKEFISNLKKLAFWDAPMENIDVDLHRRHIISRVFSHGEWSEIKTVMKFNNEQTIIAKLKHVRYFDDMTLNFVS